MKTKMMMNICNNNDIKIENFWKNSFGEKKVWISENIFKPIRKLELLKSWDETKNDFFLGLSDLENINVIEVFDEKHSKILKDILVENKTNCLILKGSVGRIFFFKDECNLLSINNDLLLCGVLGNFKSNRKFSEYSNFVLVKENEKFLVIEQFCEFNDLDITPIYFQPFLYSFKSSKRLLNEFKKIKLDDLDVLKFMVLGYGVFIRRKFYNNILLGDLILVLEALNKLRLKNNLNYQMIYNLAINIKKYNIFLAELKIWTFSEDFHRKRENQINLLANINDWNNMPILIKKIGELNYELLQEKKLNKNLNFELKKLEFKNKKKDLKIEKIKLEAIKKIGIMKQSILDNTKKFKDQNQQMKKNRINELNNLFFVCGNLIKKNNYKKVLVMIDNLAKLINKNWKNENLINEDWKNNVRKK